MSTVPLRLKRIIAYIIQVVIVIIIYSILTWLFVNVFKWFILQTAPNILAFLNLSSTSFQVNESAFVLASENFDKSTFIILYQELIIMLLMYCILIFVIVPFLTRTIVISIGDIGKKVTKLYVVSRGKITNNAKSMKSSPAFKTFKLYYVILLFFQITLPMYQLLSKVQTPKVITILIILAFIGGVIQLIASIFILLKYFIGFLTKKYFWRGKLGTEVVDNLEEYLERYNKEMEFYEQEKLTQKRMVEAEMEKLRELEIQNKDPGSTNLEAEQGGGGQQYFQNEMQQEEIYFPIFYNLMLNNNYTIEQYKMLEIKARNNAELTNVLKVIEQNQKNDPNYIAQNIDQVRNILEMVK